MTARSISIILRTLGSIVLLYVGIGVAVPILLPYVIARSPNHGTLIDAADDPTRSELHELGVTQHLRVPVGRHGISLSCFMIDPTGKPRGTVLLFHGHRDSKLAQLDVGKTFAAAGYRAILVDHCGHGLSTGDYLSYGIHESGDMKILLDTLQTRGLLTERVGTFGFSYGGAVAIQHAAKDDRIDAVVTVSTFSSLREVVVDYVRCFLPFVAPIISDEEIDNAVRRAGGMGEYDPIEADTEAAARRLRVPLLLMHGAEDRRIPLHHGVRLSKAVRTESRFVELPGCGHGDIMSGETGRRVVRESLEWFRKHLDGENISHTTSNGRALHTSSYRTHTSSDDCLQN